MKHHVLGDLSLTKQNKTRVCYTAALAIYIKNIIRQKKKYANSNISPCKHIIFKKSSKNKLKNIFSFKIL
jgi:hypothetical protein